jgi:predicted transcriptional regulator
MIVNIATWLTMASKVKDILHSGKRDKMEIMAAIVAMTQKPAKITEIMGQTKLNHTLIRKYIKHMLRLRLIEACNETEKGSAKREVFRATERGLVFFRTYCELLRIIYGEDFLKIDRNLAVTCLKYCRQV